jgi:hypothetical protein
VRKILSPVSIRVDQCCKGIAHNYTYYIINQLHWTQQNFRKTKSKHTAGRIRILSIILSPTFRLSTRFFTSIEEFLLYVFAAETLKKINIHDCQHPRDMRIVSWLHLYICTFFDIRNTSIKFKVHKYGLDWCCSNISR